MLTEHSENLTIAHPEWPMRGSDRRWRKPRRAMENEGPARGGTSGHGIYSGPQRRRRWRRMTELAVPEKQRSGGIDSYS